MSFKSISLNRIGMILVAKDCVKVYSSYLALLCCNPFPEKHVFLNFPKFTCFRVTEMNVRALEMGSSGFSLSIQHAEPRTFTTHAGHTGALDFRHAASAQP